MILSLDINSLMDVLIFYIIFPNLLLFQKHSLSLKEPILKCNHLYPVIQSRYLVFIQDSQLSIPSPSLVPVHVSYLSALKSTPISSFFPFEFCLVLPQPYSYKVLSPAGVLFRSCLQIGLGTFLIYVWLFNSTLQEKTK